MSLFAVGADDITIVKLHTGSSIWAGTRLAVKLRAIFGVTIVTGNTSLTEIAFSVVLTDAPSCK